MQSFPCFSQKQNLSDFINNIKQKTLDPPLYLAFDAYLFIAYRSVFCLHFKSAWEPFQSFYNNSPSPTYCNWERVLQ